MAPKPVKYEVEKILDIQGVGKDKKYFIKWKGYKSKHNSWEPAANTDCPDLVKEYHNRQAKSPAAKRQPTATPKRQPTVTPKKTPASRLRSRTAPATTPKSSVRGGKRTKSPKSNLRSSPRFAKSAEKRPAAGKNDDGGESDSSKDIVIIERPKTFSKRIFADDKTEDGPSSSKKARKNGNAPNAEPSSSRSKSTQSSDNTDPIPASDISDLEFTVASIKGMHKSNGQDVVVYDEEHKQHIVKCKAVAKQNLDLMLNYFIKLPRNA